jgi:hypothetical protein
VKYDNYYLIPYESNLQIVKGVIINNKMDFVLESSIDFQYRITGFVKGNENSIFLLTEYSELYGIYTEFNLDILEQGKKFPFINGKKRFIF